MASASFLAVADPRGDLGLIAKSIEFASRISVGAQAVFFYGNFVGPVLNAAEREELTTARTVFSKELADRRDYYEQAKVRDVTQLGHHMTQNAANYRRTNENTSLHAIRQLLGLRDESSKWVETGVAQVRARKIYTEAERLFKKSAVPVYVMADTIFAEESIDAGRWLHFAWFSLGGVAIRALCVSPDDLLDGVPELAPGPRRGGQTVSLAEYPLASGDVIFSPQNNPALHEMLSAAKNKIAVTLGDGTIDRSYPCNLLSSQKPATAVLYRIEGPRVIRRTYPYRGGFGDPATDDIPDAFQAVTSDTSIDRRRQVEEQAKLAGLGKDLIQFVDLMRQQNPALAKEIEGAKNRGEAIVHYVRNLEERAKAMEDLLSAQRAGMERLVKALEPHIGGNTLHKILEAMNIPPERQHDLPTWDTVNGHVAALIIEALEARAAKPAAPSA